MYFKQLVGIEERGTGGVKQFEQTVTRICREQSYLIHNSTHLIEHKTGSDKQGSQQNTVKKGYCTRTNVHKYRV